MTLQTLEKPEQTEVARTERTRNRDVYRPNVDIVETEQSLTVHADMPGVARDDIDIQFENGTLTIHGVVPDRRRENATPWLTEYGVGDFQRVFQVSESIDAGKISAEYADGVLTLHLPKVEEAKPRKITVKGK